MKIMVNGHLLTPKNDIRLLGMQLQINNRFSKNNAIRIEKARRAKFYLNRIFKNGKINCSVKTTMHKMYIRPILMYAAPFWCRQPQLSSHQMEMLRRFERSILKSTANIRRERGSYKHVNVSDIYQTADCIRIDRFAIQTNLNFYKKIRTLRNNKLKKIARTFLAKRYQCMPQILLKNDAGTLFTYDKLLIFNRRYNNLPGTVYNTGQ